MVRADQARAIPFFGKVAVRVIIVPQSEHEDVGAHEFAISSELALEFARQLRKAAKAAERTED